MSRGTTFSESQLRELGYYQLPSGEWSKDGVQDDHSKPSAPKHQHDERGESVAEKGNEGPRKRTIRFRLIVHSYRTALIDPSNASMKQIEDCLTPPQGRKDYGIGVIPDDSAEFCDQPLFLQTKVKKGDERTQIEILSYEGGMR